METTTHIEALEKEALDHWADGNPRGYLTHAANEISYYDDIGAQDRIIGMEALDPYARKLGEMIPPHNYTMADPHIQVYGETAILTYQYCPTTKEGAPLTNWRASVVYSMLAGAWKMVHAHWTMQKNPEG